MSGQANNNWRILHLTGCLSGGGAETILRALCREQSQAGHAVTIVYLHEGPGSAAASRELRQIGCGIFKFPHTLFFRPKALLTALKNAQLIQTHLINTEFYGFLLKLLFRKKWIATRYLPQITRWRRRWVHRLSLRHANMIICISHCVKDFVSARRPDIRHKCHVVYPGLTLDDLKKRLTGMDIKRYHHIATPYYALIPARLVQQKNLDVLLNAIRRVVQDINDWTFVFAGTGPLRLTMERFVQHHRLDSKIIFIGFRENIYDYISQADAVILPSAYEGFGMAVLEALLFAKPVIASDIAAIREILGETNLRVAAQNPQALAQALRQMTEPSIRRSLAAKSRPRAEYFTAQRMHEQTEQIYEQILTTRRPC